MIEEQDPTECTGERLKRMCEQCCQAVPFGTQHNGARAMWIPAMTARNGLEVGKLISAAVCKHRADNLIRKANICHAAQDSDRLMQVLLKKGTANPA